MKNLELNNDKSPSFFFFISFSLTAFIFFIISISTVLFVFKTGITIATPILSALLSIILTSVFAKKNGLSVCRILGICALSIIIVMGSIQVATYANDCSYDGNSYHKHTIGALNDGWNPVYEDLAEFNQKSEFRDELSRTTTLWQDHYAKGSHIFAACIYKATGDIETGKSINLISLFSLVFLSLSYLNWKKKRLVIIVAFSLALLSYPVFITQCFTNYVDLLLGIYLFILIFCFFLFDASGLLKSSAALLCYFFMALCIMINIKFSAFAYAGIYCFGYYVWYILRLKKRTIEKSFFCKFTIAAVFAVIVGVFVIGLSVYPKNFINHGNPFYPLFGEGKVDIMTSNTPTMLEGLSPIEKFIHATFSEAENTVYADNSMLELKNPFTIKTDEYYILHSADLRIGGHGPLFGGVLILSILVILFYAKTVRKTVPNLSTLTLIPLFITILMAFTLDEIWWARYFPQAFLFPLFAILYLDERQGHLTDVVKMVLIFVVLFNNSYVFFTTLDALSEQNNRTNAQYAQFENTIQSTEGNIVLYTDYFVGALYNVIDKIPEGTDYTIKLDKPIPDGVTTFSIVDGAVVWSLE